MDALKKHVDSLFKEYSNTKDISDLKNEILSNLQAKTLDLSESGMSYEDAVKKAKESISSIDYLIDGNTKVYINRLKLEYYQILLIYVLAAWIFTIPMEVVVRGMLIVNNMLFIISIVIGISFLIKLRKRESNYLNKESWVNINSICKVRKTAWILWALFILVTTFLITGVHFGSNIWFSRPIKISGPYQFAVIALSYIFPMFSVIIPAALNKAPKLILKYEVPNGYEEE